jgi:hypothetical protein
VTAIGAKQTFRGKLSDVRFRRKADIGRSCCLV